MMLEFLDSGDLLVLVILALLVLFPRRFDPRLRQVSRAQRET